MAEKSEHEKVFTIIVNGRKRTVNSRELTYEDVVNLAYDNNPPVGENVVITVTYSRGDNDSAGSLLAGQEVKVKEGMVFNVKATDRS